jgi:CheY-like chemotaxis protein
MQWALEQYEASVTAAASADEALVAVAAAGPGGFDVVLSDIAMPGGDGYWLVREIRQLADALVRSVPVVAVTAFGREHSRARTLSAGFADHLQKPVDPEVLCQTVARAAGR